MAGQNYAKFIDAVDALLPLHLARSNEKLIKARWLVAGSLWLSAIFCERVLDIPLAEFLFCLLAGVILGYNFILAKITKRIEGTNNVRHHMRRLVLLQIILDWLSAGVFLHLTGGVTSPALPLFFIHILLVTVLLRDQSPLPHAMMAVTIVVSITIMEAVGILPHYVLLDLPPDLHTNGYYVAGQIIFISITLFSTVYLSSSVVRRLQQREQQISALFLATQAVSSSLELEEVLNRLAENAAHALGVFGSSIRLLDVGGERLTIFASYGLSRNYLDKGSIEVSQSLLDRNALDGKVGMITDAASDPRLQYPKEAAKEGIRGMLVVPIIGKRPLGVLRVYSFERGYFKEEQVSFMMAIARQGATAIENAMAHDALQKAEEQRTQFVRIITHELRTPVTGSQSLVRVLQHNLAGELSEQQQDIIGRLGKRMDSLLVLINDLLSLAENKAIELQQMLVPTPVKSIVKVVIDQHWHQAAEKNITLDAEMPPGNLMIIATQDGLKRVMDNLVSNAIKYTPKNGKVSVKITAEDEKIVIEVCDTGIGIPEEALEHLGEEFFRASNARQSGIIGTGLGLTVTKQLIDYFKGHIEITSVVNQGTTVKITLPY